MNLAMLRRTPLEDIHQPVDLAHEIFVFDPAPAEVAVTLEQWARQGRQVAVDQVVRSLLLQARNRDVPLKSERTLLAHLSRSYFDALDAEVHGPVTADLACCQGLVIAVRHDLAEQSAAAKRAHVRFVPNENRRQWRWVSRVHLHYPPEHAAQVMAKLIPTWISPAVATRFGLTSMETPVHGRLHRDAMLQSLVPHPDPDVRAQVLDELRRYRATAPRVAAMGEDLDRIIDSIVHFDGRARLAVATPTTPVMMAP